MIQITLCVKDNSSMGSVWLANPVVPMLYEGIN